MPANTISKLADSDDLIAVALQGTGGVAKAFNDRAMLATGLISTQPAAEHDKERRVPAPALAAACGRHGDRCWLPI